MLILFGMDNKENVVGPLPEQDCPNCRNTEHWTLFKVVKYGTLFFVPVIPFGTDYLKTCPICKETVSLSKDEFEYWTPLAKLNQAAVDGKISREQFEEELRAMNY